MLGVWPFFEVFDNEIFQPFARLVEPGKMLHCQLWVFHPDLFTPTQNVTSNSRSGIVVVAKKIDY